MSSKERIAFLSIAFLFFLFGFVTCLNDILNPQLKRLFELSYTQATLVQFAFFSAYFFFSIPAGLIVKRRGYANGILAGLAIMGTGALLFLPAGQFGSYPLFLSSLFVLACGITLLQVAANPYATALGPKEGASARLTLVQAFNSLGTTIAPMVGSYLILARSEGVTPSTEVVLSTSGLQTALPYVGIGTLLFVLVFVFRKLALPQITDASIGNPVGFVDRGNAIAYPALAAGIVAIFCYVGAEVGIGSFLVSYMAHAWKIPAAEAGKFVALYWGGTMAGRFMGSYFLSRFKPAHCLRAVSLSALTLVLLSLLVRPEISPYFLLLVGLLNSIMFPVIFSLAIKDLGPYTSQGASYLCMAIVGGALLPFFQGMIADVRGLQMAFVLPLIAYFLVFRFAWKIGSEAVSGGHDNASRRRNQAAGLD